MSGRTTATLLRAVLAAGATPELDTQDAITTAYSWHGGGDSALYAFASNGGVVTDDAQRGQLVAEVEKTIAWVEANAGDINSGKFSEYADDAEEAQQQGLPASDYILARLANLKDVVTQTPVAAEPIKQAAGPVEAEDLRLYAESTGTLYPQKEAILRNLQRKLDKGTYDPNLAWRLWLYWVTEAARSYAQEHGGVWYQIAPMAVRTQVAKEIATDEEQRLRNGEHKAPNPAAPADLPEPNMDAIPVHASADKEAKQLISEDVFRRAQAECQQLLERVAGTGSELEGKLTKIQHELNKVEAGSGGDLEFMLDDESNPESAMWVRRLIQALSSLKGGLGQGAEQTTQQPAQGVPVHAGFAQDTLKAVVQFARVHKTELQQLMQAQGPQAVAAEVSKAVPGAGGFASRITPAFLQWLSGATNDSGFVGLLERLFSKQGSVQNEDAVHMVTGALHLAGFTPTIIKATGRDIVLEGLKVNAHVLRVTAKVAADYNVAIKLRRRADYAQPGEQPETFPEPARQEPVGVQHAAPTPEPVVTPTEAAKQAAPKTPAEQVAPAMGNHSGPSNPVNPTGHDPEATTDAAPIPPDPKVPAPPPAPAPAQPTGYGQHPGGAAYGQKQASEMQGDLYEAVQSAYEWHSGQSSYLYSFASLGGVLYKESWRGGLENEVESAIEAVQRQPQSYEADELEKLQNLLTVAQTIPAQTNDEEQDDDQGGAPIQASAKQADDGTLRGILAELESMLGSCQELADSALAKARIQGDPDLSANVERTNAKVTEALMAVRTSKVDAKDTKEPETDGTQTVTLVPVTAGITALVTATLDKGPDASKGDTVDNAIEWVNANSTELSDGTVQDLRNGLSAAGFTQQVADEAVTELLGNEALQALATKVKDLLG